MTTIVLCHGAWGGGWSWTGVADILRHQGHRVFVPTYTGLGERAHLASADVDLSTHIKDVRALIEWERLDQFVLAGHSYGGMVISGVADAEWQKITRLIYLDAFLPGDGQSLNDLTGPERAAAAQAAEAARGCAHERRRLAFERTHRRIVRTAGSRGPVDGVLEHGGNGAVVFGRCD